ncbi:unnamed protein product [Ixodes persulcatus]
MAYRIPHSSGHSKGVKITLSTQLSGAIESPNDGETSNNKTDKLTLAALPHEPNKMQRGKLRRGDDSESISVDAAPVSTKRSRPRDNVTQTATIKVALHVLVAFVCLFMYTRESDTLQV